MFTMSFVDGYSISNKDRVIADGFDPEEIGRNIVDNYVHQALDVGTGFMRAKMSGRPD